MSELSTLVDKAKAAIAATENKVHGDIVAAFNALVEEVNAQRNWLIAAAALGIGIGYAVARLIARFHG